MMLDYTDVDAFAAVPFHGSSLRSSPTPTA